MSAKGAFVVDLGITTSSHNHPIHFVTGLITITVAFTAIMFVVRACLVG